MYDWIICNLAMMASQYYGMPVAAFKTQAKNLRAMEFHLQTAFEILENSTNIQEPPPYMDPVREVAPLLHFG